MSPAVQLEPTTWPLGLIADAVLDEPPSVPRSTGAPAGAARAIPATTATVSRDATVVIAPNRRNQQRASIETHLPTGLPRTSGAQGKQPCTRGTLQSRATPHRGFAAGRASCAPVNHTNERRGRDLNPRSA